MASTNAVSEVQSSVIHRAEIGSASSFPDARAGIASEAGRLRNWLFYCALPVWARIGTDRDGWGFHECVDLDGSPFGTARRARVQVRQVFSFATGGRLGWSGTWQDLVRRGYSDFQRLYMRGDNVFRTVVGSDGLPLDDTPTLYDQAFAMLALAHACGVVPGADQKALDLLRIVESTFRHDGVGFRENADCPYQSNPHMHLLEACLAWMETGGADEWRATADRVVRLALDRFIDRDTGVLREFFAPDWSPAPGEEGRLVEPGHQYEWAWLLMRWSILTADQSALRAAGRLVQAGDLGVDPHRNVAVNLMRVDGSLVSGVARLWPQTERLKAKLGLWSLADGPLRSALEGEVLSAIRGLEPYLKTPTQGLWYDKMLPDGRFVEEPAPASSLYHIVCAVEQLCVAARTGSIFQAAPDPTLRLAVAGG
jgi:mannose-6-phosphate isomerase